MTEYPPGFGAATEYPWRKVTGRTTVPRRDFTRDMAGRAHWFWYRTEDLECGHRLTVVGRKTPSAARRRCRQCPKDVTR